MKDYKAWEWLEKNELSYTIWDRKYRFNNESFDEWLNRVSGGDERLQKLIFEKKFMFGGRITANRGTGKNATMMNCYSRGFVDDSLEDIMQASTDIAMTFKAQGGQGLSLSKLRPKGAPINKGQFKSDGIVPFMELFNRTTESISQGGSRKGALLMSLDIWHKEAEEFIKIKSEEGRIQKANLSLEIDDDFMSVVENYYRTGERKIIDVEKEYEGNKIRYEVDPVGLYKLMMEKAWDWGEPGCIFTNRFRNYNLMEYVDSYSIETCNPCGEQPLAKNSACDLGSINLSEFVKRQFTDSAYFDSEEFVEAVHIGIKALDRIIDENQGNHALHEQEEMSLNYRNVGLGIMGLYDALVKLNIRYGSEESVNFVNNIMALMFRAAVIESCILAKEHGPFPMYDDSVLQSKILRKHFTEDEIDSIGLREYGLRNCSLLSIAPAGSIGTLFNVSTGCEPAFMISYDRKTESLNDGEEKKYQVFIKVADEYFKQTHSKKLPDFFVTAHDIPWHERIAIQSALQEHVDTAISSTINLSHDTTVEEIEKLYLSAWKFGLKGVTIFRDGCRRTGILTTDNKEENADDNSLKRGDIVASSDDLVGKKRKLITGCGSLHCEAFFDPKSGELRETYFSKGSTGGCNAFMVGLSRLISLAARGGISLENIADQLASCVSCPSYAVRRATKHDTSLGNCCPMAIGNALMEMSSEMKKQIEDGEKTVTITTKSEKPKASDDVCPECGGKLIHEGGCVSCKACGYTKCD